MQELAGMDPTQRSAKAAEGRLMLLTLIIQSPRIMAALYDFEIIGLGRFGNGALSCDTSRLLLASLDLPQEILSSDLDAEY